MSASTVLDKLKALCEAESLVYLLENDTVDDTFYINTTSIEVPEQYIGNSERIGNFQVIIYKQINLVDKFTSEKTIVELGETVANSIYTNYSTDTKIEHIPEVAFELEDDFKIVTINTIIRYEV